MVRKSFHAAGLFLYPLRTLENQRFSDVFKGFIKRPVAWNWLIILLIVLILKRQNLKQTNIKTSSTKYNKIWNLCDKFPCSGHLFQEPLLDWIVYSFWYCWVPPPLMALDDYMQDSWLSGGFKGCWRLCSCVSWQYFLVLSCFVIVWIYFHTFFVYSRL